MASERASGFLPVGAAAHRTARNERRPCPLRLVGIGFCSWPLAKGRRALPGRFVMLFGGNAEARVQVASGLCIREA